MGHSDEWKSISGHGFRADGKHQSCHGNSEKQQYWKHIVGETLNREFTAIAHAELYRQNQPGNHYHRRNIQKIEMQKTPNAVNWKLLDRKSKKKHAIGFR